MKNTGYYFIFTGISVVLVIYGFSFYSKLLFGEIDDSISTLTKAVIGGFLTLIGFVGLTIVILVLPKNVEQNKKEINHKD